jgi:hypothetical protein
MARDVHVGGVLIDLARWRHPLQDPSAGSVDRSPIVAAHLVVRDIDEGRMQ